MRYWANNLIFNSSQHYDLYKYGFVLYLPRLPNSDLVRLTKLLVAHNSKFFFFTKFRKQFNLINKNINLENCLVVTFENYIDCHNFPYFLLTNYKFNYFPIYRKIASNFFDLNTFNNLFVKFPYFMIEHKILALKNYTTLVRGRFKLLLNFNVVSKFVILLSKIFFKTYANH